MNLQIITPVREVLNENINELVVPTETGEITILPNHVSLITKVVPGELTIKKERKIDHFAITGGFLEVRENSIVILADYAVRAEDIEIAKAKEAQEKAVRAMKEKSDRREFAVAEADMKRAIVELQVARKYKKATPS